MIQSFKDVGTEDVFNGRRTKVARRTCPQSLWKIAARKLDQLDSVTALQELQIPPGNRLEALKGDRDRDNIVFALVTNTASVFAGQRRGQQR
jgi:toxin HigB-1